MTGAEQSIPEIEAVLAAFLAGPEPYMIHLDRPLDLRSIATETRLLPVVLDGGGCIGLLPSGEVASFLWDEPRQLLRRGWVEGDVRIRNLVYYQASLKFPEL